MKKLWQKSGIVAYWILLPALHVYLRIGQRTRIAVTQKNQLLVVKPWLGNGKWCLPGGGVHRHENTADAAKRELFEETGVKVNNLRSATPLTYGQSGLRFRYVLFTHQAHQLLPIVRQPWELVDVAWRPIDTLSSENSNQDVITSKQWL